MKRSSVMLAPCALTFCALGLATCAAPESDLEIEPPAIGAGQQAITAGVPSKWSDYHCVGNQICRVGDINGDGKDDLVTFVRDATPGQEDDVWIALSNGSSFGVNQKWHDSFCKAGEQCAVGDIDADGKDDLIAFVKDTQTNGQKGDVQASFSSGSGFGPSVLWKDWFCVNGETCATGDVNGDGRVDLVAFVKGTQPFPAQNDVWVSLAPSNGIFDPPAASSKWHTDFCSDGQQCAVADVTGDGRADLLAFTRGPDNDALQAPSLGNAFGVASKLSDYFCVDGETCMTGDADGDGVADLFAFVKSSRPDPDKGDVWVSTNFGAAWRSMPAAPSMVMHSALIHTASGDKLLLAGGSQYNCCHSWGLEATYLYDIASGSWQEIASPYGPNADVFCAGHAHDTAGNVVFYGGNKGFNQDTKIGIAASAAFQKNGWFFGFSQITPTTQMWYPSLTLGQTSTGEWNLFLFLGNKGKPDDLVTQNINARLPPGGSAWIQNPYGTVFQTMASYPRTLLLPNGKIFVSSPADPGDTDCVNRPYCGANHAHQNYLYDPANGAITFSGTDMVPDAPMDAGVHHSWYDSVVMLPLQPVNGQYPSVKVMLADGPTPYVKDVAAANPTWQATAARPNPKRRESGIATLLPTGQVVVTGGSENGADATAVHALEIYGEDSGGASLSPTWMVGTEANVTRGYHSVALLLPDGRVWTTGTNKNGAGSECYWHDNGGYCDAAYPITSELGVEILEPWYYGRSDRPTISSCPADMIGQGALRTIGIGSSQGTLIDKVALMAPGSMTHAFDSDQRLIWLDIDQKTTSSVVVKTPYTAAAAPPGDYMLFVLKKNSKAGGPYIPSVACWTKR